jgi:hypothetical protein
MEDLKGIIRHLLIVIEDSADELQWLLDRGDVPVLYKHRVSGQIAYNHVVITKYERLVNEEQE